MVGTTGWKRCLGAVVCVLVMAVGGCGSLNPLASPGTPSPSLAPTYDPDRPKPKAPKGSAWIHAPRGSVLIPVPKAWQTMGRDEMLAAGGRDAMDVAAKRMGMDSAAFEAYLKNIDSFAIGARSKGFAPNISAVSFDGDGLPTSAEITAELKKVGGKPGKPRTVKTKVGPAIVLPYSLTFGSLTVQGRSIVIDGPRRIINITVSHTSAKTADQITATILKDTVTH